MAKTIEEMLVEVAENVPKVYESGYQKGKAESGGGASEEDLQAKYQEGYDAGKQAEYDAFWDGLQQNGKRTDYRYAFFTTDFESIDPKHFISASNADSIFTNSSKLVNVNWEKFDLSATSSLYNAFGYCGKLKYIDTTLGVNATLGTTLNSICRNCTSLVRVQKIIAYAGAVWKNSFDNCGELIEIIFEGIIGQNGLDLHWSTKLNKASIVSVINTLSSTTSGLTVTLSKTAVNNAFGINVDDASTYPEGSEYYNLRNSKSNWNFYYE